MRYIFLIFLAGSFFFFSCEENLDVGFGDINCPEGQRATIEDGEAHCICITEGSYIDGDDCINPCENKCSNHGKCTATSLTDVKCTCDTGYYPNNSLSCINPCEDNCSGHGVCSATSLDDAKCVCDTGFKDVGVTCIDINECDENPCIENEICTNSVGSYECICKEGFLKKNNQCIPQATYQQWGTTSNDKAEEMIIDKDGNIYITGSTNGNLDGNGNAGAKDIFLMKLDSNNLLQWTIQWGTTANEEGFGITVDSGGNIYVTGYTNGEMGGYLGDSEDIFLTKVTPIGTIEWTKQWGTDDVDVGYAVTIDNNDNIYVTGKIDGDNVVVGTEQTDMFLSKFDINGTKAWTKVWGGNKHDVSKSVVVDSLGDIYIAGWSEKLLGGSSGGKDIFILKSNSDGVESWRTRWGTSGTDEAKNLLIDSNDNLYVTGFTTGSLETKVGGDDIFLSKINIDNGARLWSKQLGTTKDDNSKNVNIYNDKLYIVGTTEVSNRAKDIFLAQLSTDGVTQWSQTLGTMSEDLTESFDISSDGTIYITGSTEGDLSGTNFGEEDIFLMKFLVE